MSSESAVVFSDSAPAADQLKKYVFVFFRNLLYIKDPEMGDPGFSVARSNLQTVSYVFVLLVSCMLIVHHCLAVILQDITYYI